MRLIQYLDVKHYVVKALLNFQDTELTFVFYNYEHQTSDALMMSAYHCNFSLRHVRVLIKFCHFVIISSPSYGPAPSALGSC